MDNEFKVKIPSQYQKTQKESSISSDILKDSELILFELPKNVNTL